MTYSGDGEGSGCWRGALRSDKAVMGGDLGEESLS